LPRSPILPIVLAAGLTLALGACGSSGTKKAASATAPAAGGARPVTIKGYAYKPGKLTIKAGTTLDVTNKDSEPHTLTADDKSFDTGNLSKNRSKPITLTKTGTFPYYCTLHPYMKGTITVR
jgi:plastocyanin